MNYPSPQKETSKKEKPPLSVWNMSTHAADNSGWFLIQLFLRRGML